LQEVLVTDTGAAVGGNKKLTGRGAAVAESRADTAVVAPFVALVAVVPDDHCGVSKAGEEHVSGLESTDRAPV
jgi:hypothetical protein